MNAGEVVDLLATVWEAAGEWVRANWLRSQSQEIVACFERGGDWPEVRGA